jgi:hypothetical protein
MVSKNEYLGFQIDVTARQTDDKLWTASWTVLHRTGRMSKIVPAFNNRLGYKLQSEAEAALANAKAWINEKEPR